MGLLDDLLGKAIDVARQTAATKGNGAPAPRAQTTNTQTANTQTRASFTKDVTFFSVPSDLEQFKALPQASMQTPFNTAALTVLAFSLYPEHRDLSLAALDFLRGPNPLSGIDKQFIADRFMDKKDYVPRSYFNGATPQNDYTPSQPWTVRITAGPYAYQNEGYAKLAIRSGGADSPREVVLRKAKDGKWYLWEQYLLADVRPPESSNPWA